MRNKRSMGQTKNPVKPKATTVPATTLPPAARGDEFAPSFEAELKKQDLTLDEALKKYGSITGASDAFAGQSRSSSSGALYNVKKPIVLSSKAAQKDLDTNITPGFEEARLGIEEQRALLEQQRAIEEQAAAESATMGLDNATKQAKINEANQKSLLIQKELDGEEEEKYPRQMGQPKKVAEIQEDPYAVLGEAGPAQMELDRANKEYFKKADAVSKTILDIQKGVVPFTAGEKAQIRGLEQEFKALIQEQRLINTSATGTANIRGYQTGSAEYDPNFAVATIGSIASAGVQRIATLNTQMASAVAELEQSFKDKKMSAVKDAYEVYKEAAKERKDALQETVDDIQAEMKAVRDAQAKSQAEITKIIADLRKNGAPNEVIMEVMQAGSADEALLLAGDYLEEVPGSVKEYLYAKKYEGYTGTRAQYEAEAAARGRAPKEPKEQTGTEFFASVLVPGAVLASDGETPVYDENGYMTPQAWKEAINDAPARGMTRKQFIETFGDKVWAAGTTIPSSYGLTPVEQKLILGAIPE